MASEQQQDTSQQQNQPQQQQQQSSQQPQYTVPGILHYLQYEWHRFEVERQEWEVERAELTAQIALLKGEKKSHENLKHDLIRRIKMLEYCLRMERNKFYKLKNGIDPPSIDQTSTTPNQKRGDNNEPIDDDEIGLDGISVGSDKFAYGRSLLKHYLEEVGSTDNYIGLRSSRVRSLVGISDSTQQQPNDNQQSQDSPALGQQPSSLVKDVPPVNHNEEATSTNKSSDSDLKSSSIYEKMLSNKDPANQGVNEDAVLATFNFLYEQERKSQNDDEEQEEISEDMVDAADRAASNCTSEYSFFTDRDFAEISDSNFCKIRQKLELLNNKNTNATTTDNNSSLVDNKSLSQTQLAPSNEAHHQAQSNLNNSSSIVNPLCPTDSKISSGVLDIGELATLSTLDSTTEPTDDYRRKQWTAKFRLQSHYDCVRDLKFVQDDTPLLVTVSEDETIKLWYLSKTPTNSGKTRQPSIPLSINAIGNLECTTLDLEPIHTYRGHTSKILCLIVDEFNIFSGAQNGELFMWNIIKDPSTADQYDKFKKSLLACKYKGHDDAVWSIVRVNTSKIGPFICSASADKTIKFWNPYGESEQPFIVINIEFSPTCLVWVQPEEPDTDHQLAVSSNDGKIWLYDVESLVKSSHNHATTVPAKESINTQPIMKFETEKPARINSLVKHPILPYLVSADSNHDIKFWDLKARKCISSMVAHLDEVTSLDIDRNGKYLLSGSHDCSVRLWLFDERSCIQEITSHRNKFDEGIFAVAFHKKLPYFATAGADGVAKVFV